MTDADQRTVYEFGAFRLDPAERLLVRDGEAVSLTPKSFDLLVHLVRHHGRLVEKATLMDALWPETAVEETNLAFQISVLRRQLDGKGNGDSLIQTVPTRGYRFVPVVTERFVGTDNVDRRPVHRMPWLSVGVTTGLAVVIALGLWSYWRTRLTTRHEADLPPARLVRLTSLPGFEECPAFSPDGEQVAFAWDGGTRRDTKLYVTMIGTGDVRPLTTGDGVDNHPDWSPDGRQVAFLRTTGEGTRVYVTSAVGGAPRKVSDFAAEGGMAWSPDSRYVVVGHDTADGSNRGIYAVRVETGEARAIVPAHVPAGLFGVAITPDGHRLAYASCQIASQDAPRFNCDADVVRLDDRLNVIGPPDRVTTMSSLGALNWTRDGQSLVFTGDSGNTGVDRLWRVRLATHTPEAIDAAGLRVGVATTTPSRDRMVFTRFDADYDVFVAHAGESHASPLLQSSGDDYHPAYSTSGKRLAFVSDRSGERHIYIAAADGSDVRQLTQPPDTLPYEPRWSPDDRQVAFAGRGDDGYWHIWTIGAEGGVARQLTFGARHQSGPTWSGDGRWVYFSQHNASGLDIWRVPANGGTETKITSGGSGHIAYESPDGQSLILAQGRSHGPLVAQSLRGGPPRSILPCVTADLFAPAAEGVYYVGCDGSPDTHVHFRDGRSGQDRIVATLDGVDLSVEDSLAVSPDGSTFLFARMVNEERGADLWLIENFR